MDLIDALIGEHGPLRDYFAVCESAAQSGDLEAIEAALAVLRRLLLAHAALEEELLLPLLRSEMHLKNEHEEIERWLDPNERFLDPAQVLATAVDLGRLHFETEERVTFVRARKLVPADELQRLGRIWAERRGVHLP